MIDNPGVRTEDEREGLVWLAGVMFALAGAVFLVAWFGGQSWYRLATGLLLVAAAGVWLVRAIQLRRRNRTDRT